MSRRAFLIALSASETRTSAVVSTWSAVCARAGLRAWAEEKGYGYRWAVETVFSTFKRLFGEHSLARRINCIRKELVTNVSLYNMMVNM